MLDNRQIEVKVGDEIVVIDSFGAWRQGKIDSIEDDIIYFINYKTERINKVNSLFFKVPDRGE